ncbi:MULTISPECIES: precorrin-3B synthase [Pseudomonas]|uniref:Precorrin-3B synthase n=1 Tax=Pseudomonas taiwanensis TaxID=470150 RepID=A0ABR6V2X1_9PSED|nr:MULTISPECIES: precorrin-3B synthase [Pseudomonas]AVD87229.1 precorrin-3B synthase [Pseudomonas sp. SWI44]MBC3474844.1 precorrin-3B synthase [Pseudomonas taiwanensis]MBC3491241.1 precorrin-3B synthase [Pseudomonas taiwanensis]MDT8926072.1 precorrin-3B synthase [Pseudomonas taiwanensis]QQZ36902.1 precorrin-3B synthase [Pseudomonas sp. SK2]
MPDAPLKQPNAPEVSPRPSACPGLWRIVSALDGGICRIKLPGGLLLADQAEAVAAAAERYAGGVIEATNRGNLQIRGIGRDPSGLIDSLLAAGLGPREAAGDDVRNVMLSPLAGHDPAMLLDVRPLALEILQMLESTPRLHQLSAKFAVQLDGGEGLAMLEHPHDLWLSAVRLEHRTWLAFGLAGSLVDGQVLGAVPVAQGLALVRAVLERFLDLASPEQSRMRQLLKSCTPQAFIDGLGLDIRHDAAVLSWRRTGRASPRLGVLPQAQGIALGVAPPLGRLTPHMLRGAAEVAREMGDGSLRMSPWQSLVLTSIAADRSDQALAALAATGLLCDSQAPLARITACTGASGCAKAQAETKADAVALASLLRPGAPGSVHLSGCPRSCAMAHVAPATLLARSPGRYDLYLRDARLPGFGALRAANLTLNEAGAMLDLPTEHLDD